MKCDILWRSLAAGRRPCLADFCSGDLAKVRLKDWSGYRGISGVGGRRRVRLAISAPQDVPILRSELLDATAANRDSAVEEAAPAALLGLLGGIAEHKKPPENK